jgi:hypothetical protein
MENEEKKLTAEECLQTISEMIAMARNSIVDKGYHYLLWGWLVMLTSISDFTLIQMEAYHYHYYGWFIMPLIGLPLSFIYSYKHYNAFKTHLGVIISYLWMGFLLTALCIFVIGIVADYASILRNFLLLCGFALFVSGKIIRFRPLVIGAIVYWLSALACIFIDSPWQLILNAAAAMFGSVVPGYLLRNKFSKNHV